jgi:ribosome-associated protein
MNETELLLTKIVEGIQEKKGKKIVIVNLTTLQEAPCNYFVIAQGDSNTQVNAIALSIKDWVRNKIHVKAFAVDGMDNAEWVAMDYGEIIVHVFQPAVRAFYDIETLWEDAELIFIEDIQ